jgi:hypothetical protein
MLYRTTLEIMQIKGDLPALSTRTPVIDQTFKKEFQSGPSLLPGIPGMSVSRPY